ncbi:toxin [Pseudomonas syringae]|uniref:RHS repeat-associated core domain-containing protein n=1 Tax=Pseudomonas syringae TaxID=317 RepID=UPI001CA90F65|nr:RHS repeat-associated core domain-containing protein [Pseudomonas syringae]MCI3943995.1 toxin [Pseudomonas syringae]
MVETLLALHARTPSLHAMDPRQRLIHSIAFCRLTPDDEPEVRISHTVFDVAGRPSMSWDARLWADRAPANVTNIHTLSGRVLASESVDAGWRVSLAGDAGQVVEAWDGRGVVRRTRYDLLLRPTHVFEDQHCVERLLYGGAESASRNQCGQLIRHDDPAGTQLEDEYSLSGHVLSQTLRFLKSHDRPDWPESLAGRDALLEIGAGATTCWHCNPLNETLRQTDAQGNVQSLHYTFAGELKSSRLRLNGQAEKVLVSHIQYDAQQRVVSETAGNGVISTARYGTEDGRLLELKAKRGNGEVLQDLLYDYDPVGNVIRIEDRAQLTAYNGIQRIDPVSTYRYDTLYQLVEASGRESAVVNQGPVSAGFQRLADPAKLSRYTQTYRYDAGGNLQQLTHHGAQPRSSKRVTARYSNRSLPVINDRIPDETEIAAAFDPNGNLLALQAGQDVNWDPRNQLQNVRPVIRENAPDDSECYIYDASGQRLRKVRTTQAKTVVHSAEVRYLPGLEVRTDSATGETLHVVVAQGGRNNVRVLHWQAGKPDTLEQDPIRYTLNDHLGSSALELDAQAQLISQESYYPFGGTSWWAGRSAIEANYKTVRYSGKERDATGLYYYGLRYYAPWLQRWINPDPAGEGLNLYGMLSNNPLTFIDAQGGVAEIPKHIHYIWLGKAAPLMKHLSGIRRNAVVNPDYQLTLHLHLRSGNESRIASALHEEKNVKISDLREEAFFKKFKETASYNIYTDLYGDDPRHYAAASDVLRYSLINYYGGIYSDTDDTFMRGFRKTDFKTKPKRVFTLDAMATPWNSSEIVIPNSTFASHAKNPVLSALENEVVSRYSDYREAGLGNMLSSTADVGDRMKIVSDVTGPKVFTEVLLKEGRGLRKLFSLMVNHNIHHEKLSSPKSYQKEIKKRMPFSYIVEIGNSHSWR